VSLIIASHLARMWKRETTDSRVHPHARSREVLSAQASAYVHVSSKKCDLTRSCVLQVLCNGNKRSQGGEEAPSLERSWHYC
jgi:hypothetical protein